MSSVGGGGVISVCTESINTLTNFFIGGMAPSPPFLRHCIPTHPQNTLSKELSKYHLALARKGVIQLVTLKRKKRD